MVFNTLLTSLKHLAKNGVLNTLPQARIIPRKMGWWKSVQVIKHLLEKAKSDGKDPYISLLELRNTAVDNLASPAQLLMNHRLKSILPTCPQQLASKVVDPTTVTTKLKQNQDIRKQHYDRGPKQQAALQPNESVKVQVHNRWIPAKVIQPANMPNSYVVKCSNGSQLRRNRKNLRKTRPTNPLLLILHCTSWDFDNDVSTEPAQVNVSVSTHGHTR